MLWYFLNFRLSQNLWRLLFIRLNITIFDYLRFNIFNKYLLLTVILFFLIFNPLFFSDMLKLMIAININLMLRFLR